jgi:phosphatidylserine decarboxylase
VVAIEDLSATPHYAGPCRRISIFLSIFSVHVNRAPFDGVVKDVQYRHGQFKNAMNSETSECNESNAVWLDTPRGPVTVRQIAGVIARRIVCRAHVGEALAKGEKFGMIRFGSRTELYLPPDAEVCVRIKEHVKAGTTIVGRFP